MVLVDVIYIVGVMHWGLTSFVTSNETKSEQLLCRLIYRAATNVTRELGASGLIRPRGNVLGP
jgi:hypothetical protein